MSIFNVFKKKNMNENQFECTICKKTLDKKSLHSDQLCYNCFYMTYVPEANSPLNQLCAQLLDDIQKINPSRYEYYHSMFEYFLKGRWFGDGKLTYDNEKNIYELIYYERGNPVGGIVGNSVDEFRFNFLIHDFFVIRYKTAKNDIESMISKLYPLFNDTSLFDIYIKDQQKHYDLGKFNYITMKFE